MFSAIFFFIICIVLLNEYLKQTAIFASIRLRSADTFWNKSCSVSTCHIINGHVCMSVSNYRMWTFRDPDVVIHPCWESYSMLMKGAPERDQLLNSIQYDMEWYGMIWYDKKWYGLVIVCISWNSQLPPTTYPWWRVCIKIGTVSYMIPLHHRNGAVIFQ